MSLLANYLIYLNIGVLIVCAQNDGKYRPTSIFTTKKPPVIDDGRYRPSNVGRYDAGNDGKYRPNNDGKYRPSEDGKYIHIGDKDRGLYTGSGEQYKGSDSNGGQYTGNRSGGGYGKGSKGNGQSNIGNVGLQQNPSTVKPTTRPNLNKGLKDGWAIIRDERTEDTDGYHYLYETENGILAEEQGRIENLAPNTNGLRSKGFYQYTGDDGVLYRVDYVADDNGFVPQGAHIPKTPPAIQKLLDSLASQS